MKLREQIKCAIINPIRSIDDKCEWIERIVNNFNKTSNITERYKLNNKMLTDSGFVLVRGFCQSYFERNGFRLYESQTSNSGYFIPSEHHQLKIEYLDELEMLIKIIDKKLSR